MSRLDQDEPHQLLGPPPRDVYVIFSKARRGEAKVAFALKHKLEELGLYAFEYEQMPAQTFKSVQAGDVDRVMLRQMLNDCSVVVFISPQAGEPSPGVQFEIEELRACGTPTLLLHWSPEGWQPLLGHPGLDGLNIVWSVEISTAPDDDVAQNEAEFAGRQLAHGAWLACTVGSLRKNHARTVGDLLDLIPDLPEEPLLNYRLQKDESGRTEWIDRPDLAALAKHIAEGADRIDLESFVHQWRSGTDLMAERLAREARFSLIQPIRDFQQVLDELAHDARRRYPDFSELPEGVLRQRSIMLVRLNRSEEAIAMLEPLLHSVADEERWKIYESLAFAQRDSDKAAAMTSITRAIECSRETETTCVLRFHRGKLQLDSANNAVSVLHDADRDFSYVVEHTREVVFRQATLRARARVRSRLGDYDAAIADYTRILDDPQTAPRSSVSAWMDRAALYRLKERPADAITDLTRAFDSADATPSQRFRSVEARAKLLEKTGQFLAAADDYEAMTKYSSIAQSYRDELRVVIGRLRGWT